MPERSADAAGAEGSAGVGEDPVGAWVPARVRPAAAAAATHREDVVVVVEGGWEGWRGWVAEKRVCCCRCRKEGEARGVEGGTRRFTEIKGCGGKKSVVLVPFRECMYVPGMWPASFPSFPASMRDA